VKGSLLTQSKKSVSLRCTCAAAVAKVYLTSICMDLGFLTCVHAGLRHDPTLHLGLPRVLKVSIF